MGAAVKENWIRVQSQSCWPEPGGFGTKQVSSAEVGPQAWCTAVLTSNSCMIPWRSCLMNSLPHPDQKSSSLKAANVPFLFLYLSAFYIRSGFWSFVMYIANIFSRMRVAFFSVLMSWDSPSIPYWLVVLARSITLQRIFETMGSSVGKSTIIY